MNCGRRARLAISHDSVMDPWYRLGTANLMDAAYMLVHYAHLTSEDELRRVVTTLSTDNHLPFGPVPELTVGAPANLLWWPQEDLIDILRLRPILKSFAPNSHVEHRILENHRRRSVFTHSDWHRHRRFETHE